MPIKIILARQVFDSMGVPTVEVDLVTELGLFRIGVPSTDEKRIAEAVQLRDHKNDEYHGMGVTNAVKNINTIIAPELIKQNLEVTMQKEIDHFLVSLDGTENRSRLGANAILCVSLVCCKAGAAKKGVPVYRHISDLAGINAIILPVPLFTILNGGVLSTNGLPYCEYMIMPTGASSFSEAMKMGSEVYQYAKNVIKEKYSVETTYVGDNGGFSVPLLANRDALLFLADAIRQCGHNGKIELAINAAAGVLYKDGAYDINFKNANSNPQDYYSSEKLAETYFDGLKEFGVCTVFDAFDNDDMITWASSTARAAATLQFICNEMTQTNLRRIHQCLEKKCANGIAIRINQAGTLTDVVDAFKMVKQTNGIGICVWDRLGETDDLFLADLVVGLSAGQLKCGAPARSDRIGKYNQILRIEEELGPLAKYAGKNYRGQVF